MHAEQVARKTALIIDDEEGAASALADCCEHLGYNTQLASDGLQGIRAAQGIRPDVIFLDYNMPRANGEIAARQLRRYHKTSDIPIIGTGDFPGPYADVPEYLTDRIHKPFKIADIKRVLDKYAPQQLFQ